MLSLRLCSRFRKKFDIEIPRMKEQKRNQIKNKLVFFSYNKNGHAGVGGSYQFCVRFSHPPKAKYVFIRKTLRASRQNAMALLSNHESVTFVF